MNHQRCGDDKKDFQSGTDDTCGNEESGADDGNKNQHDPIGAEIQIGLGGEAGKAPDSQIQAKKQDDGSDEGAGYMEKCLKWK